MEQKKLFGEDILDGDVLSGNSYFVWNCSRVGGGVFAATVLAVPDRNNSRVRERGDCHSL